MCELSLTIIGLGGVDTITDARLATGLVEIAGVIVAVAIDGSVDTLRVLTFALPESTAESCCASERGMRIGSLVPGLTAITILCVAIFGDAFKRLGCGVIICCVPLIPILSASFGLSSGSLFVFFRK